MIEKLTKQSKQFFRRISGCNQTPVITLGFASLSCLCFAQTKAAEKTKTNLFRTLRPDLTIVIHKHSTGADMVEVSMLSKQYPPQELHDRLMSLQSIIGVEPRGLNVFAETLNHSKSNDLAFLKATFAINGILNGANGINLQALTRAFAGGKGPSEVDGIDILLDGITATPSTVSSYKSNAVEVQGLAVGHPPAVEYRVHLLSQDPKEIIIPDRAGQTIVTSPALAAPSDHTAIYLVVGFVLAAAVAGALVYTLISRRQPRTDANARSVHR